jgi:SHS2 domain-containing protein
MNCGMRLVVMNLTYAQVKGVTLHCLQVVQTSNGWEATVVFDV